MNFIMKKMKIGLPVAYFTREPGLRHKIGVVLDVIEAGDEVSISDYTIKSLVDDGRVTDRALSAISRITPHIAKRGTVIMLISEETRLSVRYYIISRVVQKIFVGRRVRMPDYSAMEVAARFRRVDYADARRATAIKKATAAKKTAKSRKEKKNSKHWEVYKDKVEAQRIEMAAENRLRRLIAKKAEEMYGRQ